MMVDKNMSILVVDDFQTMTQLMRYLLLSLGFKNVDEARDGRSALAKMSEKQYNLVISDWNMEPMSGIDFLKYLRAHGNTVPFILVTAENKTENVIEAKQAGVNNYIVKPYNAVTLKNKLVSVFGEF
jgi:two-component system, chemotaxis family, chemotaxis protein CheY